MWHLVQNPHIACETVQPVGAWSCREGNTSWSQIIQLIICAPSLTLPPEVSFCSLLNSGWSSGCYLLVWHMDMKEPSSFFLDPRGTAMIPNYSGLGWSGVKSGHRPKWLPNRWSLLAALSALTGWPSEKQTATEVCKGSYWAQAGENKRHFSLSWAGNWNQSKWHNWNQNTNSALLWENGYTEEWVQTLHWKLPNTKLRNSQQRQCRTHPSLHV